MLEISFADDLPGHPGAMLLDLGAFGDGVDAGAGEAAGGELLARRLGAGR